MNNKIFDIPINWASVAAFAVFWSYGCFGAITFQNFGFVGNLFISSILYGIFLMFLLLSHYQKNLYKDVLTLYIRDIVVFLSFLLIMLVLSLSELTSSLVNDQFYHSQQSQQHIITAILKFASVTSALNNFSFSGVLFFLNLVSIGLLVGLFYLLKNRTFTTKVILLSLGFFIFRFIAITLLNTGGPHPPLRLFPLWLSSSLFSSSDFSFRIPQMLGLIVLMWIGQRIAYRNLSLVYSWLFGLAIGTIPLLWHVSILAEQSVWTAVIWSIFLLEIYNSDDFSDFNWIQWFSLISIFTLLRQTAFLALIPLFVFYIIYNNNKDRYNFKKFFFTLVPVLVMLPFFAKSIVMGTPATYIPGEFAYIPKDASSIERVWFALKSGIAPWIVFNTVSLPWIIFFFFPIMVCPCNIRRVARSFIIFIFFIAALFTFFSIRPALWGVERYEAEYIIPFSILGFYILLVKLNSVGNGGSISKILSFGLMCLIFYNIYMFKILDFTYMEKQNYHGISIKSESVYNYKDALNAIKADGYAGHTYIAGITYGILPEIMNGFTIGEVLSTYKLLNHQNSMKALKKTGWTGADPESIDASPEIKAVLVSDACRPEKIINGLRMLGWKSWKNFSNDRSGTIIYGMTRSEK